MSKGPARILFFADAASVHTRRWVAAVVAIRHPPWAIRSYMVAARTPLRSIRFIPTSANRSK